MIELQDVLVAVPDASGRESTILRPTSLRLGERRISIIGSNGSGKSTLARLLNGLVLPTAGSVRVRSSHREGSGAVPAPRTERWLDTSRDGSAVRREVGFVFTDPNAQLIMPTAVEDVSLSLRRTHRDAKDRHAAALQALGRFGLAAHADQSVHSLSGGQKQLLAIAAVLAAEPAILVADEPTTLLDLRNSRRVSELLFGLPQQLIVVTHDLELAARAERTLVVEDGSIVFDGAPDAAIARYRALVDRRDPEA